jgi:hypothetical protein
MRTVCPASVCIVAKAGALDLLLRSARLVTAASASTSRGLTITLSGEIKVRTLAAALHGLRRHARTMAQVIDPDRIKIPAT